MCTALTYQTRSHYFGRNLDLEHTYGEAVTITPRLFPLPFRRVRDLPRHYAMIGVAHVADGYPLYYDATNEKGLSMAALSFPHFAHYGTGDGPDHLSPFELIPWILGQCADLNQARGLLSRVRIDELSFSPDLPNTPLHWLVADRTGALAVEPLREGLRLTPNPVEVLTNSPPLEFHLLHMVSYLNLTAQPPVCRFAPGLDLEPYSRGMGAMGLPGDLSSSSRFVRAAFTRSNSHSGPGEEESVSQFFHILGSVAQQRGCARLEDGREEFTVYSSCCNTDRGIYYYTTYENSAITGVDLHQADLDGCHLLSHPLLREPQIRMEKAVLSPSTGNSL